MGSTIGIDELFHLADAVEPLLQIGSGWSLFFSEYKSVERQEHLGQVQVGNSHFITNQVDFVK